MIALGAAVLDILTVKNLDEWELDIRSDLVVSAIVIGIAMRGIQASTSTRHRRRSPWRHDFFGLLCFFFASHAFVIRLFASKFPSVGHWEIVIGHVIAFLMLMTSLYNLEAEKV